MKAFLICSLFFLCSINLVNGQWIQSEGLVGGGIIKDMIEFRGDLYIGTHGNGVYRSTDNGNSWNQVNMPLIWGVESLAIHKDQLLAGVGSSLYMSPDGDNWVKLHAVNHGMTEIISDGENIYLATLLEGVFKSEDDGQTWINISNETPFIGGSSIAKRGANLYLLDGNGDVFKSPNEGENWVKIEALSDYYINDIFINASGIYAKFHKGILKSEDDGISWKSITDSNTDIYSVGQMYIDGSTIFVDVGGTIYISEDDGRSWEATKFSSQKFSHSSMLVNEDYMFLGTWGGGVMRNTRNIDQEWRNENKGLHLTQVHHIKTQDDLIFVGTENSFVRTSNDQGATWKQESLNGFSGGNARAMIISGDYVFIGQGGGGISRRAISETDWEPVNNGLTSRIIENLTSNENYLFASTMDGIFRSGDDGENWTGKNEGIEAGIRTLYTKEDYVFAGTWDGIYLSEDNGNSWEDISNGLPDKSVGSIIYTNSTLFVSTQKSGLFKTSDFGLNWEKVSDERVHYFAEYNNYLFFGSFGKLMMSEDLGETWIEIDNGQLPDAYVNAIGFSKDYILIGTVQYGHGILKRNLHELMPPTLLFYTEKNNHSFRTGEKIFIESDQAIRNSNGEEIDSEMLSDIITIFDSKGQETMFTAMMDESKRRVEILIENPSENESYTIVVQPVINNSGLSNAETQSNPFKFESNNPPVLSLFTLNGSENSEIFIDLNEFVDAFKDEEEDSLEKIIFTELPQNGTLFYDDEEVIKDFEVIVQEFKSLKYIPKKDFTGSDQISWNGFDGFDHSSEDAKIDIFINSVTGLLKDVPESDFRLYPNPTSSEVKIAFENNLTGDFLISLQSLEGEKIRDFYFKKDNSKMVYSINIESLPGGVYILQLISEDFSVCKKVMKY